MRHSRQNSAQPDGAPAKPQDCLQCDVAAMSGTRRFIAGKVPTAFRSLISGTGGTTTAISQVSINLVNAPSTSTGCVALASTKASPTMLSIRRFSIGFVCIALITNTPRANGARAAIGCPALHNGKALKDIGLFEGPPANKVELMPETGRFVIPQIPKSLWSKIPNYTLGCTYRGTDAVVTIVLPRQTQVCKFTNGPQVQCR